MPAQARREFFNDLGNDNERPKRRWALNGAVCRRAGGKGKQPGTAERKKLRLEKSLPEINRMSEWIKQQLGDRKVLAGGAIGKAPRYSADGCDGLSNYL